jgi:hypothetical protein
MLFLHLLERAAPPLLSEPAQGSHGMVDIRLARRHRRLVVIDGIDAVIVVIPDLVR